MSVERYREQFEAFLSGGGGAQPSWLIPVRRAAMDRFSELGFPTTRNEDWHFTSSAPIAEADLRLGEPSSPTLTREDLGEWTRGFGAWPTVVMVNGHVIPELSSMGGLPAGVKLLPLARAWQEVPELVERHIGKLASNEHHAFTALNTAFMMDGVVIHVPANVEVPVPIHVIHLADASASAMVSHPRTLVVAERCSKVTLIETFAGTVEAMSLTNAVAEVLVEDGATVEHYKLQRESTSAFHVGHTEVHQARDSHYVSLSFAIGAALSRTNIYTKLDGENCGSTLYGLYMADGEQHVDHQTRIEHAQPNCFSREVYKGVLTGSSHGVFNGKVYVHPIAQKTDGKQSNHTLLLSEHARMDTKPQLEIFADDVKCTHGATVGQMDELSLFYMKSRGVSDESARKLLTYAFAADVLEEITLEPLRRVLEELAMERFTGDPEGVPVVEAVEEPQPA